MAANELALEGEDRVEVAYEDIPQVVIDAVIATEDKNFFEHQGADPVGLARAAYQLAKGKVTGSGGGLQGGSTITQQYIKLTSGDKEDSYSRKAREIVRAIKFEQQLVDDLGSKEAAKQEILERYLNLIYFGRRSNGVAAAARNYFDKDLDQLSVAESAFLAGLIRNAHTADPIENPDEAARRRTVSLVLMEEQEYITADQRALAEQDDWSSLVRTEKSVEGLGDVKGPGARVRLLHRRRASSARRHLPSRGVLHQEPEGVHHAGSRSPASRLSDRERLPASEQPRHAVGVAGQRRWSRACRGHDGGGPTSSRRR